MKRIVIVGAGVAGMTAGILLSQEGYAVTVLERGNRVGGNLTGWTREGCHIDNCLHWLTGTAKGTRLGRLWRRVGALGRETELKRTAYFYRSFLGESSISLWRDPEQTRREMHALSPADQKECDRFLDAVLAFRDGGTAARARAVAKYARVTLAELSLRFCHPLLRLLFTDYIGGEYSALGLIFAYGAYIGGNADLPAGGSLAMAERMAARLRALGGNLLLNRRVTRAVLDGRRITALETANGESYAADAVIFACDPHVTFDYLLPEQMRPRKLERLDRSPRFPGLSALHVAFSVNASDCPLSGTVCFSGSAGGHAARAGGRMALRIFDHEPSFAPEGKLVLQLMLFVTEREACEWIALRRDPERYRLEKQSFTEAATDAVLRAFPSLAPSLKVLDSWTPATYARYTGAYKGNFIGYALTGKALPPRLRLGIRGCRNAYLASGWMRMPSGLPSAARVGEAAAKLLHLELLRQEILAGNFFADGERKKDVGY